MRTILLLAAAAVPLASAAASAQIAPGAPARNVAVELREEGKLVASSTVRLQLGRAAAITLDGGYSMRLRVDPAEGEGYTVRPNLTAGGPGGWTPLRASPLLVPHGQRGTTRVERPAGPALEIAVSVD